MKTYTKTEDKVMTSLLGGKMVSKASLRVEAYGTIDELNSFIGYARIKIRDKKIDTILYNIQRDLFELGADIATPINSKKEKPTTRITLHHVRILEQIIKNIQKEIPPLKNFLLPYGEEGSMRLHLARTTCRRAERCLIALSNRAYVDSYARIYVNRLSDLLFILARYVNLRRGIREETIIFKVK